MMLIFLLMVSLHTCAAMGRGPHHPRGGSVVKHHVHYRPTRDAAESMPDKVTQDQKLLHDKEHIQEDLGEWAQQKNLSAMTDEELEFYYFKLHDYDNNNHLDGLEILQAIQHTVNHQHEEEEENPNEQDLTEDQYDFDYYVEMIDRVFSEDDANSDGFLSYPEYVAGKRKDVEVKSKSKSVVPVLKTTS